MQAPTVSTALNPALNPALSPNTGPSAQALLNAKAAAGGAAAGPDSFSRLLEAADARRQPERQESSPPKPAGNGSTRPAAPASGTAAAPTSAPRPPTGEAGAEARRTEGRAADDDAAAKTGGEGDRDGEGETESSGPADAATLLASLGLVLRPQAAAEPAAGRGRSALASDSTDRTASLAGAGEADTGPALGLALPAAAGRRGSGGQAAGDDSARAEQAFAGLLAQAGGAEADGATTAWAQEAQALAAQPASTSAELRPADGSALLLAGSAVASGAPTTGSAASPAEARLSHTPGSPAFADELGAQISTFVRDGVQHAKLQLHPLELGPVTVQIQLDGGSAHMSFAAEHAQTRQALEQALPTLASSLREAGLTLSGGGVFEQPRQAQPEAGNGNGGPQRRAEEGGDAQDGGATTTAGAAGPAPARRRGVVDLVA